MTEIPAWWLVISAIFFVTEIVFLFCLIFVAIRLMKSIQEIVPKVTAISERVEHIGGQVESLTANVKETMETVGGRVKSVAGSAELVAHTAARSFEKFSPAVVGILSALKVLKAVMEFRDAREAASRASEKGSKEPPPNRAKVDKKA